ncbi:type IV secretion system protein VirB3 [Caulobacter rhizosphaerae]|jgi:type IV secretion system protein VirB3|uniref:type IV secretion system protein VirB3 n=1 Tax=Caulobacter rhizosphaerae TaxID=2010972 RepID=UPI0013D8737D|nr:type IV secretion system protein VirB3 [Caulobacter rhizosphaerae]GGL18442.1 type IV secretion protein VirB3 [Caulobacter rhizosphaerae]
MSPADASEERLTEDTLFLACTRPTMVAGAPMEAVGLIAMTTAVAFLAGRSLIYLLIAPALWLTCRAICRNDHNAFRILLAFVRTRSRANNRAAWGGGSPTPLALRRRFIPQEVDRG